MWNIFSRQKALPTIVEELIDDKSTNFFNKQNFDRNKFSYNTLLNITWWPDEILIFIEVLNISYNQFISYYITNSDIFDDAIRNVIYFMNQKKYKNITEISAFVNNSDFKINDNYINSVIKEDNCYMRESEKRPRSPNEQKHYLLFKALEKMVSISNIEDITDNELVLKKEYLKLIRIYVIVYNLKNMYCIIDDTLRNVLSSTLKNLNLNINLHDFFGDLLLDLNNKILIHLQFIYFIPTDNCKYTDIHDNLLFNKVNLLKDLMLYAYYNCKQFNHLFNVKSSLQNIPFSWITAIHSNIEGVIYPTKIALADEKSLKRIEYIYKFYLNLISTKNLKDNILNSGNKNNFEELLSKMNNSNFGYASPRYLPLKNDLDNIASDNKITRRRMKSSSSASNIDDVIFMHVGDKLGEFSTLGLNYNRTEREDGVTLITKQDTPLELGNSRLERLNIDESHLNKNKSIKENESTFMVDVKNLSPKKISKSTLKLSKNPKLEKI